jgi:hypothetical protein
MTGLSEKEVIFTQLSRLDTYRPSWVQKWSLKPFLGKRPFEFRLVLSQERKFGLRDKGFQFFEAAAAVISF